LVSSFCDDCFATDLAAGVLFPIPVGIDERQSRLLSFGV